MAIARQFSGDVLCLVGILSGPFCESFVGGAWFLENLDPLIPLLHISLPYSWYFIHQEKISSLQGHKLLINSVIVFIMGTTPYLLHLVAGDEILP